MSGFMGQMKEFRQISIDRFDKNNLRSTVFFLSHCHRDHMVGLDNSNFLKCLKSRNGILLYCSEVTKLLLLSEKCFKPLEPYIVVLQIGIATTVALSDPEMKEFKSVAVTALPAGHCPGSVMFLFEGHEGRVLYTGDFRWERNYATTLPALCINGHLKEIDSVYIDTTFCVPEAFYIPRRDDCLSATASLVVAWLQESSQHFVHISSRTKYGHEPLLAHLAKEARVQVHASKEKVELYDQISELRGVFTSNRQAKIHACSWQGDRDGGSRLPCGYNPTKSNNSTTDPFEVMVIRPSTMWFTAEPSRLQELVVAPASGRGMHRVCYSFHSSFSELRDLVSLLKPRRVHPNVLPASDTEWCQVRERLERFLTYQHKHHMSPAGDTTPKSLGLLKRKRKKSVISLTDSEGLVFDSPPRKAANKSKVEDNQDKDAQPSSQKSCASDLISPAKSDTHSSYQGSGSEDEDMFAHSDDEDEAARETTSAREATASKESQSLRSYVSGDEDVPEEDQASSPQFRHFTSKDDLVVDTEKELDLGSDDEGGPGVDQGGRLTGSQTTKSESESSRGCGAGVQQVTEKPKGAPCEKDLGNNDTSLKLAGTTVKEEKKLLQELERSTCEPPCHDIDMLCDENAPKESEVQSNMRDVNDDTNGQTVPAASKQCSVDNFSKAGEKSEQSGQCEKMSKDSETTQTTGLGEKVRSGEGGSKSKPGKFDPGRDKVKHGGGEEDGPVICIVQEDGPLLENKSKSSDKDSNIKEPAPSANEQTASGLEDDQETNVIISDSDSDADCKITKTFARKTADGVMQSRLGHFRQRAHALSNTPSHSYADPDGVEEPSMHFQHGAFIDSGCIYRVKKRAKPEKRQVRCVKADADSALDLRSNREECGPARVEDTPRRHDWSPRKIKCMTGYLKRPRESSNSSSEAYDNARHSEWSPRKIKYKTGYLKKPRVSSNFSYVANDRGAEVNDEDGNLGKEMNSNPSCSRNRDNSWLSDDFSDVIIIDDHENSNPHEEISPKNALQNGEQKTSALKGEGEEAQEETLSTEEKRQGQQSSVSLEGRQQEEGSPLLSAENQQEQGSEPTLAFEGKPLKQEMAPNGKLLKEENVSSEGGIPSKQENAELTEGEIQLKQENAQLTEGDIQSKQENAPLTEGDIQSKQENAPLTDGDIQSKQENSPLTEGDIQSKQENSPLTDGDIQSKQENTLLTDGDIQSKQENAPLTEGDAQSADRLNQTKGERALEENLVSKLRKEETQLNETKDAVKIQSDNEDSDSTLPPNSQRSTPASSSPRSVRHKDLDSADEDCEITHTSFVKPSPSRGVKVASPPDCVSNPGHRNRPRFVDCSVIDLTEDDD